MSEPEQQAEQRSSIKIIRNAKGDAQFEVKAYDGVTVDEMSRLRQVAVDEFKTLEREFYGAAA